MLRTRSGLTTDRERTSVMTETHRNRWFSKAEAPRSRPDLLDPSVNPRTAFPDEVITGASPEFGGEVIDLGDQK